MNEKEKYFIDLSKSSEEQIKALPQKFENAGHNILSETLSDLISGKITDGFKFLFYSPSGWNQNDYPLNGRTELTYPEFIKLLEGGESKEVLQVDNKISIKEITELCNEYNRSDLKISNLKRDLEYKKSWNEESFAIQEIKQQISILQKIKETAQSKLQDIGIEF